MRRRDKTDRSPPTWSRHKMLALLIGVGVTALLLVAGVVLTVLHAVHSSRPSRTSATIGADGRPGRAGPTPNGNDDQPDPREVLAARPMPSVVPEAAQPGPVSTRDPGTPITLSPATRLGPAQVPTGYPHTPAGAMAQLAAIDQAALQSGSLAGARAVIAGWALPGGPTGSSWSVIAGLSVLFDDAGLSGGGSPQLAILATPLMGMIKGSVGVDFVIPCVDFELDVTLAQSARAAAADCQRMVWHGDRWMIGAGSEPATPPSVWPDTDTAISVGYRDLRQERP